MHGTLVLISMRAGISVCVLVMMMLEVVFSGERSLSVMEQECLRVGFWLVGAGIFDFGGNYVAVVVKTEVLGLVVRLYISNVRWSLFEMMLQADFLSFLLFLGSDRLREMMSVKEDGVGCRDSFEDGCKGDLTQFRGAVKGSVVSI